MTFHDHEEAATPRTPPSNGLVEKSRFFWPQKSILEAKKSIKVDKKGATVA